MRIRVPSVAFFVSVRFRRFLPILQPGEKILVLGAGQALLLNLDDSGEISPDQCGFHVYYLTPDRQNLVRVIDNLVKPNGIIGTADGKRLYVADPGDEKIYAYRIRPDGSLSNRKSFAPEGSDGMTLDEKGNLYLTHGAVQVYAPTGKRITTIETPEKPANVCFGGQDRRTLFITARKGFYSIHMNVRGQ